MEALEDVIKKRFPGDLVDRDSFEDFFDRLMDDVRGPAINVVNQLGTLLANELELLKQTEGFARDHWDLFGDLKPTKSAASARSKLARDLENEDGEDVLTKPRLGEDDIRKRLLGFSDLARVRIVCTLNQDVKLLLKKLFLENNHFLQRYPLKGEIKDFVFEPNRRGALKGHRARQFSVQIDAEACAFGFEVQLMTTLQHAWDRRNHPLYEWTREGGELPDELRVNDFACSEALHLVDQQSERNWDRFLEAKEHGQ